MSGDLYALLTERFKMKDIIYWEQIRETGSLKGFFGTWFVIMFRPKAFCIAVKSSKKILPPFLFAWLNMFISALYVGFFFDNRVYEKMQISDIGFAFLIIPIIYILPIFLVSLVIYGGLRSNSIQSDYHHVFRLLCYSWAAIFLIFHMDMPTIIKHPILFSLAMAQIIRLVLLGLMDVFEIDIYKALNSSIIFILFIVAITISAFFIR